jgi:glycosyltransferase involved in cell wall biosynthesis
VAPVRVLFVYDHLGYPDGVTHGLTRYCGSVLPRLNDGPVQLTACFLREAHPAAAELERKGLSPVFLARSKWDPRALTDVLELIRKHRIEVVHAVGQKGILVGRTAARLTGCAALIHLRDMFPLSPPVRMLMRATAHWTDLALGVSGAVRDYAVQEYKVRADRAELLYNGIALEDFAAPPAARVAQWREAAGIPVTARTIGVIGRLASEKGHSRLLRQMPRILQAVPDAMLVIVGGGPLRSRLEQLTRELGLTQAVRFVGQQNDVPLVIGALDAVAIPSDHEGFSLVALEAMALGKPIVASDVGGLPEVLNRGAHGILCPLDVEHSLADALVQVLTDPGVAARMLGGLGEHLKGFSLVHHVERQRRIYIQLGRATRERRSALQAVHVSRRRAVLDAGS